MLESWLAAFSWYVKCQEKPGPFERKCLRRNVCSDLREENISAFFNSELLLVKRSIKQIKTKNKTKPFWKLCSSQYLKQSFLVFRWKLEKINPQISELSIFHNALLHLLNWPQPKTTQMRNILGSGDWQALRMVWHKLRPSWQKQGKSRYGVSRMPLQ